MSKQQEPSKPKSSKKPKAKKLNLDSKSSWRDILKRVDKREVPIQVLERLLVNLIDGTAVIIDVKRLLQDGIDPDELETHVNERLQELDEYIENIDFFVDIDKVEQTVQPETDKLLSKL